jgi:hypothetical protein
MNPKQYLFVGLVCVSFAAMVLVWLILAHAGENSERAQVKMQRVEIGIGRRMPRGKT